MYASLLSALLAARSSNALLKVLSDTDVNYYSLAALEASKNPEASSSWMEKNRIWRCGTRTGSGLSSVDGSRTLLIMAQERGAIILMILVLFITSFRL